MVTPDATVTDAGTVSEALLSDTVTIVAAVAAFDSVTVQVLLAEELRLVGEHASEVSVAGATRLMDTVWEEPLRDAVRVADWSEETVPAVAVKVADVDPAATVTDDGTVNAALLLDIVTAALVVAAVDRVTVQPLDAPELTFAGEHCSPATSGTLTLWTLMTPPTPVTIWAFPSPVDAKGPVIEMGTLDPPVDGAMTTVMVATTPLLMVPASIPLARQVTDPATELQLKVLPAAVKLGPAATVKDEILPGEYESVHCSAVAALAYELFRAKVRVVEPPA